MSTMKIVTPKGAIRLIDKVVPVVETRFKFNGQNRRFAEPVASMKEQPTALALHYADNTIGGFGCGTNTELIVGNLTSQQVVDIQQALVKEGIFDFSSMEYQDASHMDKTIFDKGASKPYTSDITCIFETFTGITVGAGFNNMGCMPCGHGIDIFDEGFNEDTDDESDNSNQEESSMNRSSLPIGLNKLKKWWDDPNRILRCDLPFQRLSGAWNSITRSSLVWSLLADSYVPAIVLLKDKSGVDDKGKDTFIYNIEDGQQRLTNLFSYMNDEWACHSATPVVEVDGFQYDLAGLKFSELPEELQNALSQFRFSVQCLENYTMEEAETLFYNINSGVALSAVQKAKSKMGTELIKFFATLLDGNFFTQAINITEAQARREDDLLILLQAALLLDNRHENVEYKSISAANCLSYASSIRGSYNKDKQQMLADVIHYLDRAFTTKNKFLRKNNAPIVIVMAKVALEQGITEVEFCGFINMFANSIYPAYEEASGSGNIKAKLVQMRLRVMFLAFCKQFDLDVAAVQSPFADNIPLQLYEEGQDDGEVAVTDEGKSGVVSEEQQESEPEEPSDDENSELNTESASPDAESDIQDKNSEEEAESDEGSGEDLEETVDDGER